MRDDRTIPRLMLITTGLSDMPALARLVDQALAGGVDAIQIRDKGLDPAKLAALAREMLPIVQGRGRLSVNGNPAVAAGLGVDVHLPEDGTAPAIARHLLGSDPLVGRSVHSPTAAGASAGADYLIAGHIFPSPSKADRPPLGVDGFQRVVRSSVVPVLAVGGIEGSRVADVIGAGGHGVAVIRAITETENPRRAAQTLRRALDEALERRMEAHRGNNRIVVNGKDVSLPAGTTIADFLASKGFEEKLVVVELNGVIVPRGAFSATGLEDGAQVEIVHFVGGG